MGDSSSSYHEPYEILEDSTRDEHRALVSLQEELEAVDWYQQRIDACDDDELKAILAHNRDEELEHASMLLEWLRRRKPVLNAHLQTYLYSDAPITEIEVHEKAEPDGASSPETGQGSWMTIGSLKGERS